MPTTSMFPGTTTGLDQQFDIIKTDKSALQEVRNTKKGVQVYCEWRIKDLKSHFEPAEAPKLRQIISPDFDGGHWRLLFHPQSDDKGYPSHCSLYFEAVNPGDWLWQSTFSFVAHIQPSDRSAVLATQSDDHHTFTRGQATSWGFPDMGRRKEIYFDDNSSVKRRGLFIITVLITATPKTSSCLYPFGLMRAITAVLDDPDGSDVEFKIKPRAGQGPNKQLYAYSNILVARSEYFRDLLEGDWQESQINLSPKIVEHESSSQEATKTSLCHSLEDSDVDMDDLFPMPQTSLRKKRRTTAPMPKRQVVVEGTSYRTLKALLIYLLTNEVWPGCLLSTCIKLDRPEDVTLDPVRALEPNESLLKSIESAHDSRSRHIDWFEGLAQRPSSPKSLYALADRYNLSDLKERCKAKIIEQVSCHNVLWEVLSPFSVKYKEIFAEQVKILIREWPKLKDSKVISTLADHPEFPVLWTAISPYVDLKENSKGLD